MNLAAISVLAFAMSTDAFAAAVGKGTALLQPRWSEALRTGAIFGVIEAITPLIGWALGSAAADYVEAWDHWIAFVLLLGLGGHMLLAGPAQADHSGAQLSLGALRCCNGHGACFPSIDHSVGS